MESFIINVLHIGKIPIPGLWMLIFVHADYVHYHPIDDLCLAIKLGMECSEPGVLGVQWCPKVQPECARETIILM